MEKVHKEFLPHMSKNDGFSNTNNIKEEPNNDDYQQIKCESPHNEQLKEKIETKIKDVNGNNFQEDGANFERIFIKEENTVISESCQEVVEKLFKKEIKEECDSYDEMIGCHQSMVISDINYDCGEYRLKQELNNEVNTSDATKIENEGHLPSETVYITETVVDSKSDNLNISNDEDKEGQQKHRFKCTECNYSTNHTGHFNVHLKRHMKKSIEHFSCEHCSYRTIYRYNLIQHQVIHNPIKPFQCEICQEYFNYRKGLRLHMVRYHNDKCQEKILQCDQCSYSCVDKKHLLIHKMKKHGCDVELVKHTCSMCDFFTFHKGNLKKHILRHDDKKPFVCAFCNIRFKESPNLSRHVKKFHKKHL